MPTPAIESVNLTKSYGGRPIVRDLSFQVNPGEVYALVGPNGAGKTTVIRLVSGLAFPTSGQVRLLGQDPHQHPGVRRSLGAVVEAPAAFYPFLTGRSNLRLHAELAGGVEEGRSFAQICEQLAGHHPAEEIPSLSLQLRLRCIELQLLLAEPAVLVAEQ